MPLTSCRECGHQVSTEAPTCPSCGVPEPAREPQIIEIGPAGGDGTDFDEVGRSPLTRSQRWTRNLLIAGAAFGLLGICSRINGGDASGAGDEISAFVYCNAFVEERLAAPTTAEYPDAWDADIEQMEDSVWRVASYVDAENGFGAKLRRRFVCQARPTGDGWELLSLTGL